MKFFTKDDKYLRLYVRKYPKDMLYLNSHFLKMKDSDKMNFEDVHDCIHREIHKEKFSSDSEGISETIPLNISIIKKFSEILVRSFFAIAKNKNPYYGSLLCSQFFTCFVKQVLVLGNNRWEFAPIPNVNGSSGLVLIHKVLVIWNTKDIYGDDIKTLYTVGSGEYNISYITGVYSVPITPIPSFGTIESWEINSAKEGYADKVRTRMEEFKIYQRLYPGDFNDDDYEAYNNASIHMTSGYRVDDKKGYATTLLETVNMVHRFTWESKSLLSKFDKHGFGGKLEQENLENFVSNCLNYLLHGDMPPFKPVLLGGFSYAGPINIKMIGPMGTVGELSMSEYLQQNIDKILIEFPTIHTNIVLYPNIGGGIISDQSAIRIVAEEERYELDITSTIRKREEEFEKTNLF